MDALKSIYEQELVNDEGYKKEHDLFAQINGDNGLHGLSFINKIEANHFNGKIEERLSKRRSRTSSYRPSDVVLPVKRPNDQASRRTPSPQKRQDTFPERSKPNIPSYQRKPQRRQESESTGFQNSRRKISTSRKSPQRKQESEEKGIIFKTIILKMRSVGLRR